MRTKFILISYLLILPFCRAETLNFEHSFKKPEISRTNGKTTIKIGKLPLTIKAGKPRLPFKTLKVLLPKNAVIEKFKAERIHTSEIERAENGNEGKQVIAMERCLLTCEFHALANQMQGMSLQFPYVTPYPNR